MQNLSCSTSRAPGSRESCAPRHRGAADWRSSFDRGTSVHRTEFCKLALTETKGFAQRLVEDLETRVPGFAEHVPFRDGVPEQLRSARSRNIGSREEAEGQRPLVDAYYFCIGGAPEGMRPSRGRSATASRRFEVAASIERLVRAYLRTDVPTRVRAFCARHDDVRCADCSRASSSTGRTRSHRRGRYPPWRPDGGCTRCSGGGEPPCVVIGAVPSRGEVKACSRPGRGHHREHALTGALAEAVRAEEDRASTSVYQDGDLAGARSRRRHRRRRDHRGGAARGAVEGVWVNAAAIPRIATSSALRLRRGSLAVAVSTGGASPRSRARCAKRARHLGEDYAVLADVAGDVPRAPRERRPAGAAAWRDALNDPGSVAWSLGRSRGGAAPAARPVSADPRRQRAHLSRRAGGGSRALTLRGGKSSSRRRDRLDRLVNPALLDFAPDDARRISPADARRSRDAQDAINAV